jgi:hypothetical protein
MRGMLHIFYGKKPQWNDRGKSEVWSYASFVYFILWRTFADKILGYRKSYFGRFVNDVEVLI